MCRTYAVPIQHDAEKAYSASTLHNVFRAGFTALMPFARLIFSSLTRFSDVEYVS